MYFKKILSKACFTSIVLSQDGRADLQDCCKCGRASAMQTLSVFVRFVAFLRQPCNKAQGDCTVDVHIIAAVLWHSQGKYMYMYTSAKSFTFLACLAAGMRPQTVVKSKSRCISQYFVLHVN